MTNTILPGFDIHTDPADAAHLASVQRLELESALLTTDSIDFAAGQLERNSPLFAGLAPNLFS